MFILDSLSLSAAAVAAPTKQQQITNEKNKYNFNVFIEQNLCGERKEKVINILTTATPTSTETKNTSEMTTNKYKQQQQQQWQQQRQQQPHIKVIEKTPPHDITEVIKNNSNENIATNNTTIGDNTMPQEQSDTNNDEEWGKVPAKSSSCKNSKCNCVKCSNTNTNTTSTTIVDDVTNTYETMNVDNNVQCLEEQVGKIMLTKTEYNVNVNTFVLQPPSSEPLVATATTTLNHDTSSCCYRPYNALRHDDDDDKCKGIQKQQQPQHSCTANNDTHDYDGGIGDSNSASGSFCHNCNNNNKIILNTNSFVTVQCSSLTCENEREQESQKQNEYKNSGTVDTVTATSINSATIAELSAALKENELFSYHSNDPLGNLCENMKLGNFYRNVEDFESPQDIVLENFEKFLDSVKLENNNLNRTIAECDDLIDFSENSKAVSTNGVNSLVSDMFSNLNSNEIEYNNFEQEILKQDKCDTIEQNQCSLAAKFNENFEKTTDSGNQIHVNNTKNNCNFENLVYCDLNETLEEQNLLESKEILEFTAELTQTPPPSTTTKNQMKRADNVDDTTAANTVNENIMMVVDTKVNETKTPVTCINVNSNYEGSDSNNSKEQLPMNWQTCAHYDTETSQNTNSCRVEVTEQPTTTTTAWSSSIENISPHCRNINQSQNTNTGGVSSSCCVQTTTSAELCNCHFTSTYTLRDFAKCLKPSADEDITYTLKLKQKIEQNQNEKEKFLTHQLNQLESNQSVSNVKKSIENCVVNEKQVKLQEITSETNENNLHNNNLTKDSRQVENDFNTNDLQRVDIFHVPQTIEKNTKDLQHYSGKLVENNEIVKLKDTQFLEIENLTTPLFCHTSKELDVLKTNDYVKEYVEEVDTQKVNTFSYIPDFQNSPNSLNSQNIERIFDSNEKIYTKNKQSQPLLYLTFVWPTKNEGQVVTTSRQGNEDQRENEIAEPEYTIFNRQHINNNKSNAAAEQNENDNVGCFHRRVLEKTYGTCNIKDVEGSKAQTEVLQYRNDDKLKEDLLGQRISLDKQKREFKNQCLSKNESEQNEKLKLKVEKTHNDIHEKDIANFHLNNENNTKFNTNQINKEEEEVVNENIKSVINNKEIFINNSIEIPTQIDKRNRKKKNESETETEIEIRENCEKSLTSEYCDLPIKLSEEIQNNPNNIYVCLDKNNVVNENITSKSFDLKTNRHNRHLNKTESLYNQDNGDNILNLNGGIKRLNETKQNINDIRRHTDSQTNHYLFEEADHLNLEEFEASQRLKRLLQQHHQHFRTRYDTIPPTQFDCHQQTTGSCEATTTTTTKSLNFQVARHSKENQKKGNLLSNNLQKGVVNNNETTLTTKANKLLADYEKTLERSSIVYVNEQKQSKIELYELQDKHNGAEEEKEDKNKKGVKVSNNINTEEKTVEEEEEKDEQKESIEHSRNSPLAYVSEKIVRLSQQQKQQKPYTNPLTVVTTGKQQHFITVNRQELGFPTANTENSKISETIQKCSPTKQCNLNLQHIVNTKQIVKEENLSFVPNESVPLAAATPPPLPTLLNEYKSAFVSTKPEVYKLIKPLTQTTSDFGINTTAASATLSEFDTQRLSDFLHLNHLTTPLTTLTNANNNNKYNPNLLHVSATTEKQQSPLYTTNANTIFDCYDELLNDRQSNEENNHSSFVFDNDIACEDDSVSVSSTTSSPCDCINCQQEAKELVRDRQVSSNFVTLNKSLKMREVNGQLRGLLKKPNRPPPTRKNRVVFDETRNEFFEADYIILIREDCAYDEEDEEPCTCGEHELVRLCCEEGCQCNYSTAPATTDDNRTPQSPKFAPPIEFVDDAALSPPDGYKDNGLKNTLGGALSGHIFGAQHLQQLQVIQRLQQQRAAMLAARNNTQIPPPPPPAAAASVNQQPSTAAPSSSTTPLTSASPSSTATSSVVSTAVATNNSINQSAVTQLQQHSPDDDTQGVCTECAECAECAAKQLQQDAECNSPQCREDLAAPLGVPAVALLPIHTSSPERRMTQKEIIAGEERPRYVLQAQYKSSPVKNRKDTNSKSKNRNKFITVQKTNNQRYVVETITMTTTTVTERRLVREASEDLAAAAASAVANGVIGSSATLATAVTVGAESDLMPPALPAKPGAAGSSISINNNNNNNILTDAEKPPPIPPKESSPTTQISGILKGGKLWKQDSISQSDDQNNTTSEDEAGSTSNGTMKRSVRFVTEDISGVDDVDGQSSAVDEDNQINNLIPIKKHSTLFKNSLRPNSAVQQLFPSTVSHQTLTSEALRAFDESKRAGCLVSTLPGSAGDSDTLRRSMERNILRRSLIKKKAVKSDISLEDRIKQLTCGIDEDNDECAQEIGEDDNTKMDDNNELSQRDSPAGEENPQKFTGNGNNSDKSFSPNSSVSSSSSGSSAYKKITEIFNRDKKSQEKIMEMEENPIVIIPQECRCPAAPDLGMGVQVPVVHTQIHRTPPRQTEPKRQFLSTLAPLTACVAGNKDDLSSYYTLAAAHHNQAAQNVHAAEYNLAAMMAGEQNCTGLPHATGDEIRKVAPDVIAGTPGQEQQDELAAFAQQEAIRTEKIKKRYGNEPTNTKETKEINSDDDEGNDYGFNKRPSVRGIKPKFSSTNEILQQMQEQLSQQMPSVAHSQPLPQAMKSYTLPKQSKQMSQQQQQQQPSPQNVPHPIVATSQQQQQQLPQQQQICNAVAPQTAQMQLPANAAIAQQQTEQRTWSFYSETGCGGGEQQQQQQQQQQHLPVESAAAAMQQTYYQTLPAGAMFRHTMIQQHQQHGQEEAMMYAQNCQAMATTIEPQPHYGHYARSPTRRPESPPPLRNYHQTMVLIPYNAETYSQFAATNMDPKVAHIQRQNILEYQQVGEMTQVTQQTIRVPIGYALPGMQLHVVAGRGHAAQYANAGAAQTHHHQHQHQRIMTQRYQFAQDANMAGFSERGVPEGAAAVSHSDCASSGMVSPTTGQQIAMQQQQLQQNTQMVQQQQQQQQLQQVNCQQQQQQQQQQQPQAQNNMQSGAQGSVYYAMNV